jgi:hypothetical protein
MTIHAVEAFLWRICTDEAEADRFRRDPAQSVAQATLSPVEQALLIALDVRALADLEVNDMLLLTAFQVVHGFGSSLPEYMRRMNTPASASNEET